MDKEARNRAIRTLLQFIVAGGLAQLVEALAAWAGTEISPMAQLLILALFQLLVTYAHNELEARGWVRPVLKDAVEQQP